MIWSIRGIVFVLIFELFSFFASKLELLLFNDSPGAYNRIYQGNNWRTEEELWGAWHQVNSQPDRHQTSCFDVTYKSNDVGARDSINYLTLLDNNNVAIIGDSFVEGWGVNNKDTFSYKLKVFYGKQGLNFGVSGNFGPVQEYLLYKLLIAKIPHNEVIYFFLPSNDFDDNDVNNSYNFVDRYRPYFSGDDYKIVYPDKSTPTEWFPSSAAQRPDTSSFAQKIKTALVDYTWSANTLRTVIHLSRAFSSKFDLNFKNQIADYSYFTYDKYSVNGAMHYVEKLFSEIPKNYKKTIIIIPTTYDLNYIASGQKYKHLAWYEKINKIAIDHDAKLIDLANYKNYDTTMFQSCDGHWNKKGNEIALEVFLSQNAY
jgi:hypothetical protein